jgi:hypothetical protein
LAGFGPVPNCGQAVAFPPAAAPWVGYRRETCLTLPRGWLGGVPIVAGSWSMFTTGMRRIRSRVLLLVRSRCAGPPSVLDVAGQRRFGFCWRCLRKLARHFVGHAYRFRLSEQRARSPGFRGE